MENIQPESIESENGAQSQVDVVCELKRTLLKFGWVAPVIAVVTLPRSGFAANLSDNNGNSNQSNSGNSNQSNNNNGDNFGQSDQGNNGNHFGQSK